MSGQEVMFTGESPLTHQHGTDVRRIILAKDFKGSRERGLRTHVRDDYKVKVQDEDLNRGGNGKQAMAGREIS